MMGASLVLDTLYLCKTCKVVILFESDKDEYILRMGRVDFGIYGLAAGEFSL